MSLTKVLFSLDGRISRQTFWLVFLPVALLSFAAGKGIHAIAVSNEVGQKVAVVLFALGLFPFLWINIAIGVKRLHDIGWPGAMLALTLIPYAGPVLMLLCLGCMPRKRSSRH